LYTCFNLTLCLYSHNNTNLFTLQATEEELLVEENVKKTCGVKLVQTFWGQTLFHKDDLPFPVKQ